MLHLTDRVNLTTERRSVLERQLAPLTLLQDVVRWGFSFSPPRDVGDVVIQDEYSHDVVVPWEDGCYLVFDTT